MKGSVRIYVDKNTKKIYLLKEYKTSIGFWRVMGDLVSVDRDVLKKNILACIRESIESYGKNIEKAEPFRKSPYKTWNRFFKYHSSISCEYDIQTKKYHIALKSSDEKTHSYGRPLPNCEFTLTETEFDERFDEIMDFLISKVEMIK